MRVRRFTTELRLHQLRCIYRRLAQPAQETLANAAQILSCGQHPPRIWVFLDSDQVPVTEDESPHKL
jgi:hypothetical protein